MDKTAFLMFLSFFLFLAFISDEAAGQYTDIQTEEIESLIDEWNFANNTHNVAGFEKIYSERLLFYTRTLPRSVAIERKLQLFKRNPNFRQRIVTVISYTPYPNNVIRCDFVKEVRENGNWKQCPSYLLVRYEDRRYQVIGESHSTKEKAKEKTTTDDPLPFLLEPDTATMFEDTAVESGSTRNDSSSIVDSPPSGPDTADAMSDFESLSSSVLAPFLSAEMIAIPKGYIFIFIVMLAVGGLMIFVADSISTRKEKTGEVLKGYDAA